MMMIHEYKKGTVLHMGKHDSVMSQQQNTREPEPVEDEPRLSVCTVQIQSIYHPLRLSRLKPISLCSIFFFSYEKA